jgi:gliding-associated putative ABC transporter substrate-binding component GldG
MMNFPIKNELFTNPYRTVAMLLEGKFTSAYKNRLAPEFVRLMDSLKTPFKSECDKPGRMIVISLGDAFSNGYTVKDGVLPIGYFKWTGEYFANKTLLLNSLEYLTDTSGILEARSKEVKVRLLDQGRIRDEKSMWTAVNVGVPITAVFIFASAYLFFRKRRYESKSPVTKNTINTNG